mmetsp:Transcript_1193/g.3504  ORF Transcript_1193/g.3504 Transcript_1193/m.3504 type:complete len:187 (-) Transcript_1193:1037-1597(-)
MASLLNVNRYEQEFLKDRSDAVELTTRGRKDTYLARFKEDSEELRNHRIAVTDKGADKDLVQEYYSISTDLYEYGWGESFHFGILWSDSSFEDAIRRYEYFLALKMKLNKDDLVLDLGCGVGGPMRNIARFSGAKIIGERFCLETSFVRLRAGLATSLFLHRKTTPLKRKCVIRPIACSDVDRSQY